jgi:hypothetical protein
MKIFGREPVYWLTFASVTLKLLAAYGVDVSDNKQAAINAVLAAAVGIASAVVLKTGAVAAAVLGFAQSALALFGAFGLDWSAHSQGLIMSGVATVLALILHREVTAPVPAVPLELSSPIKSAPRGV